MERRGIRAAIPRGNADQNVVRRRLRIFDEHIEVAIVVEYAGVEEFVLTIVARAPTVLIDEMRIGKLPVRILVERLVVRVCWRAIQVEVALIDVLAVVAFVVRQAEQAFFQNGIPAVPQRDRETEAALAVAPAEKSVFSPPIHAAAGMIVREVLPGCTKRRVVLTDGAPLSIGQVRPPSLPVLFAPAILLEPVQLSPCPHTCVSTAHDG